MIRHHYSGSYPAAIAAYGLFERTAPFQQELVGVAVFSVPMQPRAAAAYGATPAAKFCELGRFYVGRGTPRTHWLTRDGSIVSPRALSKLRNGERGAAYAYEFLRSHGAPARALGEPEADYIRRALQEGPFRRMRHNGNHAYVFPCETHSTRQEIRRRMDKGLPRPTKTDLPMA